MGSRWTLAFQLRSDAEARQRFRDHCQCGTVDDPASVLVEVHRVLKPGGQLVFLDHVRSDEPGLAPVHASAGAGAPMLPEWPQPRKAISPGWSADVAMPRAVILGGAGVIRTGTSAVPIRSRRRCSSPLISIQSTPLWSRLAIGRSMSTQETDPWATGAFL